LEGITDLIPKEQTDTHTHTVYCKLKVYQKYFLCLLLTDKTTA